MIETIVTSPFARPREITSIPRSLVNSRGAAQFFRFISHPFAHARSRIFIVIRAPRAFNGFSSDRGSGGSYDLPGDKYLGFRENWKYRGALCFFFPTRARE